VAVVNVPVLVATVRTLAGGWLPLGGRAMVAPAALLAWRARRDAAAPPWRRPLAWTAGVLVLAWAQPLVEQFTSPTRGNLSRLAGAATAHDLSIVGPTRAVRIVAEATVVRPWFSRSSYEDAVPLTPGGAPLPDTVGLVPALLVVAGLVAAPVTVAVAARRARRTAGATLATVAVVALVVEVVAPGPLARQPHGHRRARDALAVAGGRTGDGRAGGRPAGAAPRPRTVGPPGHDGRGALALLTAGVPFVFDDEVLIRQFGEGRRNQGEATLRLWQVEGPDAVDPPPGAERVAYAEHDDGPVALLAEPIA
jgi:hypothetical protein